MFSLSREYMKLKYVRVPFIYRVNQAEYVIHILVAASQEYLNTYSTRRVLLCGGSTKSHIYIYLYICVCVYIYRCVYIYTYIYIGVCV